MEYGAHPVAFPEMFLIGYLPKICSCKAVLEGNEAVDSHCVLDYPQVDLRLAFTGSRGRWQLCWQLHGGAQGWHGCPKRMAALQNVYFAPGEGGKVISFGDEKLAVSIGEGALDGLTGEATLAINISASPFYLGKPEMRRRMMEETWEKSRIPLLFVNQVGGQGETVFDGGSMFCDKAGRVAVLPVFEDGHVLIDTAAPAPPSAELPSSEAAWIYAA